MIKLKQRDSEPQTVAKRIFGIGTVDSLLCALRDWTATARFPRACAAASVLSSSSSAARLLTVAGSCAGPAYGTVAASRLVHPASPFHTVWVGTSWQRLLRIRLAHECSRISTMQCVRVLHTVIERAIARTTELVREPK